MNVPFELPASTACMAVSLTMNWQCFWETSGLGSCIWLAGLEPTL